MVEIPVEKKSNLMWLWLLLALLLIGLLLWWVLDDGDAEVAAVAPATAVEAGVEPGLETEASLPSAGTGPADQTAALTIGAVLADPGAYVGRNDFAAEVQVPEVPTDRGFWVQNESGRMFALIIDNPQEVPLDINPGQSLRVSQGMLRDTSAIGSIPGEPIDPDTRRILEGQPVFLVVDERNIEIVSRAGA